MTCIDLNFRFALPEDAGLLAPMNLHLIRDEGHHNPMDVTALRQRMSGWLQGEYQAVIFESGGKPIGYALFKQEPEFVYIRQLFVAPEHRRQGVARLALAWLWEHAWAGAPRLRIDVLVGNTAARAFWKAAGFTEYAITMEAPPQTG